MRREGARSDEVAPVGLATSGEGALVSKLLPLVWVTLLTVALPAEAVTLERIVSREDPKFNCAAAVMTLYQKKILK
jgi:hypothetical protein